MRPRAFSDLHGALEATGERIDCDPELFAVLESHENLRIDEPGIGAFPFQFGDVAIVVASGILVAFRLVTADASVGEDVEANVR